MNTQQYKIIFFFAAAFVALPFAARAAVLQVIPTQSSADINQPVHIDIALDTQGAVANAVQGSVIFPSNLFRLVEVEDGASPVTFWIQAPQESPSGTVTFSGIMPGGFSGTADSLLSLVLDPIAPGDAEISLQDVSLLANDGKGSSISVTTEGSAVKISSVVASGTPPTPQESSIVPDSFTPTVTRDPNIYAGNYFLVFSTTDKGSGIDHYEVAEVPAGTTPNASTVWQIATSPYLLQDQSLSSDIYVRAIDHAGNSTIVKVPAAKHFGIPGVLLAILILVLLLVLAILFLWRRGRKRRR